MIPFSEEPKDDRCEQDKMWERFQDPDWGPDETGPANEDD